MIKINLGTDHREKWEMNSLAWHFMKEIDDIVKDYKDKFHYMRPLKDRPEDKTGSNPEHKGRWHEVLPPSFKDDRYFRQRCDMVRLVNSVFKDMEARGMFPQGDGPFRKKEIRMIRRDFIKLLPKEDRRSGKMESDFITKTRRMMTIAISRNDPIELKKKLEEIEKRLDKVTAWGLEGLKI